MIVDKLAFFIAVLSLIVFYASWKGILYANSDVGKPSGYISCNRKEFDEYFSNKAAIFMGSLISAMISGFGILASWGSFFMNCVLSQCAFVM